MFRPSGTSPAGPVTREIAFILEYDTNAGFNERVVSVGINGTLLASFWVPADFSTFISMTALITPSGFGGAGHDIDLNVNFSGTGELALANTSSDTTTTYDLGTSNSNEEIVLPSVLFSALAAGDRGGIKFIHNTLPGNVLYKQLILKYST